MAEPALILSAVVMPAAVLLTVVVRAARQDRRIRYLAAIAGHQDLWSVRCRHCGKPMRDAASIVIARPGPVPGSTARAVFHTDRPACDQAARTHAEETSRA